MLNACYKFCLLLIQGFWMIAAALVLALLLIYVFHLIIQFPVALL